MTEQEKKEKYDELVEEINTANNEVEWDGGEEWDLLVDKINAYHEMEWQEAEEKNLSQYPSVKEVLKNLRDYSMQVYRQSLKSSHDERIQRKYQKAKLLIEICKSDKIKNLKWYRCFDPRSLTVYSCDWSDGTAKTFIDNLVGQYETYKKLGIYTDEEIEEYDTIYGTILEELIK